MKNILFLNLAAFRNYGGLEKFNRCFLKALDGLGSDLKYNATGVSLCDEEADEKYFPQSLYKGFNNNKFMFVLHSILKMLKQDILILGHINTSVIGIVFKTLFPERKLVLVCHGIEVWQPLKGIKKRVMDKADYILAVSEYTKQQIVQKQGKPASMVFVFHNTIDPYFSYPAAYKKDVVLQKRYGIKPTDFVVYTLCRLSSKEQYKGYDAVIEAIATLCSKYQHVKYLIAGKYDEVEKKRVNELVTVKGLTDKVILAGYVDEREIVKHYQLADVFVMPSTGEGFGIVFIEAMACGRQVIGGNADGSIDALRGGDMGTIVNADDVYAIAKAIEDKILSINQFNDTQSALLQKKVVNYFGFDTYKGNLKTILQSILN
ncbi:hypothetical protein CAP35_02635 [Chitinophagaceae bacterium IBVUCB1]|nr:hypothetical protein CAP35_02635 [Chitinophagaceae bacterium IBVUCB1]